MALTRPTAQHLKTLSELIAAQHVPNLNKLAITVLGLGPVRHETDPQQAPIGQAQLLWVHEFVRELRAHFSSLAVVSSFVDFSTEELDRQHIKQHPEFAASRVTDVLVHPHGHPDALHPEHTQMLANDIVVPPHGIRIFIDLYFNHQGTLAVLSHLHHQHQHHEGPPLDHVLFISPFRDAFSTYRNPRGQEAAYTLHTIGPFHVMRYGGWTPAHSEVATVAGV